ncbi:retrovirus-related pol polyprotein from transposon TNT 1-94 [Tanacetum coccineum]
MTSTECHHFQEANYQSICKRYKKLVIFLTVNIDNNDVGISLQRQSHDYDDQRSSIRTSSWKSNHASSNNTTACPHNPEICMSAASPEEVYVAQPKGFVDPDHPEKAYLLRKALYGLKQAPKAWYDELSNFLMSKGFTKAFQTADHSWIIILHKSTSGGIQSLGDKLVVGCQETKLTAMSSAEAEYVVLSASCAQVMWMRTQLQDYGFNLNKIPLYCDS